MIALFGAFMTGAWVSTATEQWNRDEPWKASAVWALVALLGTLAMVLQ